ncbi:methyltransferase domain-containing protein [Streptomyces sp. NPDC050095]|uniref:methyltransferase domain-containing protein n=1 Tax=unclassified Streptomyces TaxID=2593676 RepID=UPI00344313E9
MHPSAYAHMKLCVEQYLPADGRHRLVDLGSRISDKQTRTHRSLLTGRDLDYIGVDVLDGRNVDRVMKKPYRIPVRSKSADFVISGQAFEHIPFFWATMLDIARVLKPGGTAIVTAPSRGHVHDAQDCWRYYPDGMRALAAYTGLELVEVHTDFPPFKGIRHDYPAIEAKNSYWGDTVGVFRRPKKYPALRMRLVRGVTRSWANKVGGVDGIPIPAPLDGRELCARPQGVPAQVG